MSFWPDATELLFIMRLTLERCRQFNVSFGLAKMEVAGPGEYVTFAGFRVSDKGFEPEKQRVKAITSYPQPQNLTDIRSFISLSQTLGTFLPNLSCLTDGLRQLLVKNTPFAFGPLQVESMNATKKALAGPLEKSPSIQVCRLNAQRYTAMRLKRAASASR